MITEQILRILYQVLLTITYPLRVAPDVTLSGTFGSAVSTGMGYASLVNRFVPLGAVIAVIGVILTFEAAVITYKTIMWIVRRVPGQG